MNETNRQDPWWYNDESRTVLNRGYLLEGETIHDAIRRITNTAAAKLNKPELAERFADLIYNGWISFSSPVWSNFGTDRGLNISCFGVNIEDSIESITDKLGEVMLQTKYGGGTSGYFGNLRHRGAPIRLNGESSGAVSFMRLFDTVMNTVSQGTQRRGSFAAYLDIDHPDVEEFLQIRDISNPIQTLLFGVCISDEWMESMIAGDNDKRALWAKVLQSRQHKGIPYLFFTDNNNKNKPDIYKHLDLKITHSNLCTEIALPDTADETFVCCLSSMNLALYDEWKDTDAVELAIMFLDSLITDFIERTKGMSHLEPARKFAQRHRAVGLGVLGYHSYLQKKNISIESFEANKITTEIFKNIQERADRASRQLALEYGPAPIFNESNYAGIKYRNTTRLSIAPTTSSSSILGQVSPGIEPYMSNYYKVGLAKGNFIRKNPILRERLAELGKDTEEVWDSIMQNQGSVAHLDFLSDHDKDVFKTFKEINQNELIILAHIRQKFIDQGQSINLNIPPSVPVKDVNKLIINAWKLGIKALYYQRSQSISKEKAKNIVNCASCES